MHSERLVEPDPGDHRAPPDRVPLGAAGELTVEAVLPAAADRWRRIATALVASAFCSFFAWKCWTLLAEAVDEGQTSNSPWAPPLWIPYGIMAVGMTMLAAQTALQFAGEIRSVKAR